MKYHYSRWANLLYLVLGLPLFAFGIDLIFDTNFLKLQAVTDSPPPFFVSAIALGLGFLCLSSFVINLLKGKNYVLEANSQGLTVYTGSILKDSSDLSIGWQKFVGTEVRRVRSALNKNSSHRTTALILKIEANAVQWPAVSITRNRIMFHKGSEHDEIIIDAWLNKNKNAIAKELEELASTFK